MLARGSLAALRWLPSVLVLVPWLLMPLLPSDDARLRDLSGNLAFRLLDWETVNLGTRAWAALSAPRPVSSDAEILQQYFADAGRRAEQRQVVEGALERVVTRALEAEGVSRSAPLEFGGLFPPVMVALTAPPNVLVVSPRSELRVTGSVVLDGLDSAAAQDRLEASADSTGVSSLVAPIGGLATFPAMVLEDDAPERVLAAVVHEWLHHYLIFYPLGAGYWNSQETREINETTADVVGAEISARLMAQLELRPAARRPSGQPGASFDFRSFMRETRAQTEQLLASGQIEAAEALMRERRDELQRRGFAIRKLNQAYFALYGSYGGSFAASPRNPIPDLLRQLREQSGSLADFVIRVRTLTTVAELRAAVG